MFLFFSTLSFVWFNELAVIDLNSVEDLIIEISVMKSEINFEVRKHKKVKVTDKKRKQISVLVNKSSWKLIFGMRIEVTVELIENRGLTLVTISCRSGAL